MALTEPKKLGAKKKNNTEFFFFYSHRLTFTIICI